MLLIMGMVLGVASTLIEVKLVHGVPVVARWYENGVKIGPWRIEGIVLNTIGSFVLSYLVGIMFAADGVTVLFGAILSTVLSQMYFSTETFCHSMGWSFASVGKSIREGAGLASRTKNNAVALWQDFQGPALDMWKIFVAFLKIVTAPLRLLRMASAEYSARR